jgi:hypothetical protein
VKDDNPGILAARADERDCRSNSLAAGFPPVSDGGKELLAFHNETALELRIMRKSYLVFFVLVASLVGCVPVDSLNPFYTDRNVIFDSALLGKWTTGNPDDGFVRFDRGDNDAYRMVFAGRNAAGELEELVFQVHLISLGGEKYLDVTANQVKGPGQYLFHTDPAKKGSRFEPALQPIGDGLFLEVIGPTPGKGSSQELQVKVLPAHTIYKVILNEKTLSLEFLDEQWVEEAIKKKQLQVRHLEAKSENSTDWVLSGSTAELQQFIVQHADDPGAFSSGTPLSKVEDKIE